MALQQAEIDQFSNQIQQDLSQTPYACSSLALLSGGTTNFLFRGSLAHPLEDGAKTIIIKYFKEFVSVNRNFKIDISRSIFEEAMLNRLDSLPPVTTNNISSRTPHLHKFEFKTNVQIQEDLVDTVDITTTVLESSTVSDVLTRSTSSAVGRTLGSWLRVFHSWVSEPAQANLYTDLGENKPMRELRYNISYGAFINVVQKFPKIWDAHSNDLEAVRDMAIAEYTNTIQGGIGENWGMVHGDFWTGNVLMPNTESLKKQQQDGMHLFVIDWEFAQFGRKEYDLGQMVGDLYERNHFKTVESALWIMKDFVAGYGAISDDMAFRVAIHAGVHLICWYIRRDPTATFTEPAEQIEDAIRIGTEFIVNGWNKNRAWFEGSELACLLGGA